MIINSKLSDEALLNAIYRAASEYANGRWNYDGGLPEAIKDITI